MFMEVVQMPLLLTSRQFDVLINVLALLAAALGVYFSLRAIRITKNAEMGDTRQRLLVLEKQMEVFWRGVIFNASQVLHSPHTPKLDVYIELFQQDKLIGDQLDDFRHMLQVIIDDPSETSARRQAARDVLILVQVRYDITQIGYDSQIKNLDNV